MRWKRARASCSSSQPLAILGNPDGASSRVRCARTQLGAPDASGRSAASLLPGTECDVPADVVLVAYGFASPRLPECGDFAELTVDQHGCLKVDAAQMTNLPGVFAAGSIARGPVSMIEAMGDARKAASAIDRYLAARRA